MQTVHWCVKNFLEAVTLFTNTTNLPFNPLVSHFNPSKLLILSSHPSVNPLRFSSNVPIQILQFLFKTCCFWVVHGERDWLKLHVPLDNVHTQHTVLYHTRQKESSCAITFTENKTSDTQHLLHSQVSCKVCIVISWRFACYTIFVWHLPFLWNWEQNRNTEILHCDYMY